MLSLTITVYHWVIILYINCGHQGAVINIKSLLNVRLLFNFTFSRFAITHTVYTTDQLYILRSTHFTRDENKNNRCLSVVLRKCLCGKSNFM